MRSGFWAQGSELEQAWLGPEPRTPNPQRTSGFSLVELIVSLAILSIGLVGAMRVFPVGLRASERAERGSRAVMVAQRALESLKLEPWKELAEGAVSNEDDGFTVTTRIRQPDLEALVDATRLKAIDVTVAWEQGGRMNQRRFVTYLHRPERES